MRGSHKTASSKELGNEHGLRQRLARFFVNIKGSTMTGPLNVETATYPPVKGTRTSTATDSVLGAVAARHETTQDMVDGFGVGYNFEIVDSADVRNIIASIEAVRDGADNSGKVNVNTLSAGSWKRPIIMKKAGGVRIGEGVSGTSDYADFAADGELTLAGTARVWRDMVLVPSVVKLPGTNPPSAEAYDNFSFHRYDKATEESVYYTWAVPHDFAVGDASLKGHYAFIISHPPVAGGNLNVRMGFEYKKISEGDVFSFTSGTTSGYIDETIVEGETAWTLHITADGTCTTTGWATDDIILFRFFRKAADAADTYDDDGPLDNDVWVKNYHLAYLSDKLGTAS